MPPKPSTVNAAPPKENAQHIYHHNDQDYHPSVSLSVERNSRGYNWTASVTGCNTVNGALLLLRQAEAELKKEFTSKPPDDTAKPAKEETPKETTKPSNDDLPF